MIKYMFRLNLTNNVFNINILISKILKKVKDFLIFLTFVYLNLTQMNHYQFKE
jgi:hypothetical protein